MIKYQQLKTSMRKVTQESQATNALKELPKSENIKSITKDYKVTDTEKITKDLRITHCN